MSDHLACDIHPTPKCSCCLLLVLALHHAVLHLRKVVGKPAFHAFLRFGICKKHNYI